MGDVLAGVIGGLLAQSFTPESAAYCGVFIHGLAGDLIAGQGLLASDVANAIPRAIQAVQTEKVIIIPIIQPKV
jgi:NAD(P)H-hydrate epimerase